MLRTLKIKVIAGVFVSLVALSVSSGSVFAESWGNYDGGHRPGPQRYHPAYFHERSAPARLSIRLDGLFFSYREARPYRRVEVIHTPVVVPFVVSRPGESSSERVGISDVIVLSRGGVSDEVIINKLLGTRSRFDLSAEEVEMLQKEGVSNRVINTMLTGKYVAAA
jgi:hypothetical protein